MLVSVFKHAFFGLALTAIPFLSWSAETLPLAVPLSPSFVNCARLTRAYPKFEATKYSTDYQALYELSQAAQLLHRVLDSPSLWLDSAAILAAEAALLRESSLFNTPETVYSSLLATLDRAGGDRSVLVEGQIIAFRGDSAGVRAQLTGEALQVLQPLSVIAPEIARTDPRWELAARTLPQAVTTLERAHFNFTFAKNEGAYGFETTGLQLLSQALAALRALPSQPNWLPSLAEVPAKLKELQTEVQPASNALALAARAQTRSIESRISEILVQRRIRDAQTAILSRLRNTFEEPLLQSRDWRKGAEWDPTLQDWVIQDYAVTLTSPTSVETTTGTEDPLKAAVGRTASVQFCKGPESLMRITSDTRLRCDPAVRGRILGVDYKFLRNQVPFVSVTLLTHELKLVTYRLSGDEQTGRIRFQFTRPDEYIPIWKNNENYTGRPMQVRRIYRESFGGNWRHTRWVKGKVERQDEQEIALRTADGNLLSIPVIEADDDWLQIRNP